MITFYLVIVIILFILAISDLVVGVSNDAVNFLNSAVGSKAATLKTVMIVAALGIVVGCTFSSGMMEVARKGIFHPEHFYFSEIILLFLAVMIADVILLDTFNSFGMPTSTTVSIVFELLGAAVAFSFIKIYSDPNALGLSEYINSGKALAIISGILLSVVVAFTAGMILQYLTRLLFSFNYKQSIKYVGPIWGGFAIAAITYFMLIKGVKGTPYYTDVKHLVEGNTFMILGASFIGWTLILQFAMWFTKIDILKLIVMVGTFALAMAFAGNDLVNFIGVPLAGYNSYQLFVESGMSDGGQLLMTGLTGKVPTPTLLLILAGIIMTITLWTSKKAKAVLKTSIDLGRQYEGAERFASYAVSRSMVRGFSKFSKILERTTPRRLRNTIESRFDQKPFEVMQAKLGSDAPSFDMVRASVTLVVASILIAIGTSLKLPLSTTYVTFMVFMGTSFADGAWGRESAVYRISGVLSVVGGWFFTAFSAFLLAFVIAMIFHFGGNIAVVLVILLAGYFLVRSHFFHGKRLEEQIEFEKSIVEGKLTRERVLELNNKNLNKVLNGFADVLDQSIDGLEKEDLKILTKASKKFRSIDKLTDLLKINSSMSIDTIDDDELEAGHLYLLVNEYLKEMSSHVGNIVIPSESHVDNNHKPFLPDQIADLRLLSNELKVIIGSTLEIFKHLELETAQEHMDAESHFINAVRTARKKQVKRLKNHEIGTRNSMLFLNHIGEYRNLALFSNRLVKVCHDLVIQSTEA